MATKKIKTEAPPGGLVPANFIYLGRRAGSKGTVVAVRIQGPDGIGWLDDRYFAFNSSWKWRSVGGLYNGAAFSETSASGMNLAKYVKEGGTAEERWQWRALDSEFAIREIHGRLEESAKRTHEIDRILYPLRKAMAGMMTPHERMAFEQYVLLRLRRSPTQAEREKE